MSTPDQRRPARSAGRRTPSGHANAAAAREHLTVSELCAELKIARSTFYDWRAKGHAPRCLKLPNGDLRVRRHDLDQWLEEREAEAR